MMRSVINSWQQLILNACRSDKKSRRFLKKAPQKLLLCWVMGVVADNAHDPN
jgi:hypothetical protein